MAEALSILGILVVGLPIIYVLMKATDERKRQDPRS